MSLNFGGERRIYGPSETAELYNEIVKIEKLLPSAPVLFSLTATAGILLRKRTKLKNRNGELVNVYSFEDAPLFEIIMARLHPGITPKERLLYLQEYAETGLEFLKEHRKKYQSIDVAMLIHDLRELVLERG